MDEARALFLSLPSAAQTDIRASSGQNGSVNLSKVARAAYPYVQTVADAQGIAQFLESEELGILDCPHLRAHQCPLSQALRKTRTLKEYVVLKDRCDACASGRVLEASWVVGLVFAS